MRIAVQNDGRLREPSVALLRSLGLEVSTENGRSLVVRCTKADVEILYVRHRDIPRYVQSGTADFGIAGENILHELDFKGRLVQRLGFGKCSLVVAVPNDSAIRNASELEGERIATTYPNSLRRFLRRRKVNASVVEVCGSVEAAPLLGLADAICDITETGRTLKENGLVPIEKILESEAVLIESPFVEREKGQSFGCFLREYHEDIPS